MRRTGIPRRVSLGETSAGRYTDIRPKRASFMRYLRRTLLCLVVGVTAFGAAGWAFRPRASWEVDLDGADVEARLLNAASDCTPTETPVWIALEFGMDRIDRKVGKRAIVEAREPSTGRLLRRVSAPCESWPSLFVNGQLFALQYESPTVDPPKTHVRIYDAFDAAMDRTVSLPGKWVAVTNNRGVWKVAVDSKVNAAAPAGKDVEPTSVVSVCDLLAGAAVKSWTFKGRRLEERESAALSPDLRLLAISEAAWNGNPQHAVTVIDLDGKEADVQVPSPPSPDDRRGKASAGFLRFLDEDNLRFVWSSNHRQFSADEQWVYELPSSSLRQEAYRPQTWPGESGESEWWWRSASSDDGTAWTVRHDDSNDRWWMIEPGKGVAGEWQRFPFTLAESTMYDAELVSFLPGPERGHWVVTSTEPPMERMLPKVFADWAPESWSVEERRCRLLDASTGRWESVGSTGFLGSIQVRKNSMIAVAFELNGSMNLQSWPLPPRDPKKPAIAVSAAFIAATWWICARRARKKTVLPT